MQTKNVKCPSCGVVLEVKNSKNEEEKIINCPQCKTTLRVKFPKYEIRDAETIIAGGGGDGKTIILGAKNSSGKAVIVCEGRRYELREGRNVLGRKATTSTADVQLEVADRYMSRLNAILCVKKMNGQMLVTIANHKNKNPIKVGIVPLMPGDELVLGDGDDFTMGTTTMTLKIERDED